MAKYSLDERIDVLITLKKGQTYNVKSNTVGDYHSTSNIIHRRFNRENADNTISCLEEVIRDTFLEIISFSSYNNSLLYYHRFLQLSNIIDYLSDIYEEKNKMSRRFFEIRVVFIFFIPIISILLSIYGLIKKIF
jgi:hypothetical protein